MASLEEIRTERLKKLERLKRAGIDAFPIKSQKTHWINEAITDFDEIERNGREIVLAGRVMALRGQGAIAFFNLNDGTGTFQGLLKKDKIDESFNLWLETVDLGDIVEASGTLFATKRGEKTLLVKTWRLLTKSLRPLPDKWHGLQDTEERFRRRYLDSLMSSEVKERFLLRSRMVRAVRDFLSAAGFVEVETPVFQPLYGGAAALPFTTHYNALDSNFYLRIAPELYLKKMLIGGFPKVFEVARSFRNEGVDVTHNPEFTMVEFYEAYSDAEQMRQFVEVLVRQVVSEVSLAEPLKVEGEMINFNAPFQVITYYELLERYALLHNPDNIPLEDLNLKANQLGVEVGPEDGKTKILDNIYKKLCRPKLIQPTFIIDYPVDYLPLAKKKEDDDKLADAFQLVIGGLEIAKAFSELNDPLDQLARFKKEDQNRKSGDQEAQPSDLDFVEAMEYGLPPAGGVGIGLDRLAMLFSNTRNIREVIYFPTLKPKGQ